MIPILYIMTHQRNPLKKLKPKLYLLRSIQRTADTRRGIKTRMFILVCRKGRPLFFNDQSTKRFKTETETPFTTEQHKERFTQDVLGWFQIIFD